MAFWNRFFGGAGSTAAGIAIGATAVPAMEPIARSVVNETWALHPSMPVDAHLAAAIVAEDVEALDWGRTEASHQGISDTNFDAMLGEALNAPGIGPLFEMWRRGLISDGDFAHGLRKAKLETRWDDGLRGLHDVLLSSQELAMGQQQGFVSESRANSEGGLQGVTQDRQQLRFEMAGLPPGVETALQMWRRGIIDEATFAQIVREGHTKTKYTGALEQLRVQILSAATAVRAHLKGHITADQMHQRGAQWGYSPADMDLWYESEGRPASVHQIHIGYARGASLPGAANEQDAIQKSVAQSNIRPEYYGLLYAGRYTYPSAFVLRTLVQSGALTRDEGEQALLFSGWEPTFAAKVADAWAGGTSTSGGDTHVGKAQNQLWTRLHSSYLAGESDEATVQAALPRAGVSAAAVADVLATWDAEREIIRRQLTPAQIRKALGQGVLNPATGATWTHDDAMAALLARGYSVNDATVFLSE